MQKQKLKKCKCKLRNLNMSVSIRKSYTGHPSSTHFKCWSWEKERVFVISSTQLLKRQTSESQQSLLKGGGGLWAWHASESPVVFLMRKERNMYLLYKVGGQDRQPLCNYHEFVDFSSHLFLRTGQETISFMFSSSLKKMKYNKKLSISG